MSVGCRISIDVSLRSPFRGYHFAQPPAIESLSLSGASHPTPSDCRRCVVETTLDIYRISIGNIVSSLRVRVFADAVSVVFAFRRYHFVQPPVIESLCSPVLRTTLQSEIQAMCSSKKLLRSLSSLLYILFVPLLYPQLSTLHSQFYSRHPQSFSLQPPLSTLHYGDGQVRSIQKRRLAFSILPIGRFVSCSPLICRIELMISVWLPDYKLDIARRSPKLLLRLEGVL